MGCVGSNEKPKDHDKPNEGASAAPAPSVSASRIQTKLTQEQYLLIKLGWKRNDKTCGLTLKKDTANLQPSIFLTSNQSPTFSNDPVDLQTLSLSILSFTDQMAFISFFLLSAASFALIAALARSILTLQYNPHPINKIASASNNNNTVATIAL